jgi:hypothetical protein
MSDNPVRLQFLFDKYTRNTCTRQELQEFWQLLSEMDENDLVDEGLGKLWEEHRQGYPYAAGSIKKRSYTASCKQRKTGRSIIPGCTVIPGPKGWQRQPR